MSQLIMRLINLQLAFRRSFFVRVVGFWSDGQEIPIQDSTKDSRSKSQARDKRHKAPGAFEGAGDCRF